MSKIEVGEFSCEGGTITGPKDYMEERGSARLERILDGDDAVFNAGCQFGGGSPERLVLVSLQTDFAAWKGTRALWAMGSRS